MDTVDVTKLAPGPWTKRWHNEGSQLLVFDARGLIVADVTNWLLSIDQAEATADLLIEARAEVDRKDAQVV